MTAAVLAGCGSDPVAIDDPGLAGADSEACRALVEALPDAIADEDAREVDPADAAGVAYGDPPIVVTCAAKPPTQFTRFSACDEVNGVGWFIPAEQVADADADVELWAVSYRPVVLTRVPAEYRPEGAAAVLAELSTPIREHLRQARECR